MPMRAFFARISSGFATVLILLFATLAMAPAATLTVSNNLNSGIGSLRQAISNSISGDTITFATNLSGSTITLTSGQLLLNKNLNLDASVLSGGIIINGNTNSRIFSVASNTSVALNSVTLAGGNGLGSPASGTGGAVYNAGTLALTGCTLSANTATGTGGAINNAGTIALTGCTLSANTTTGPNGGAVANNSGTASFTNCTFSGNSTSASTQGGGAINHAFSATSMTLTHCTLTENSTAGSDGGGGIRNRGPQLTLSYCLIAGNIKTNASGTGPDVNSTVAFTLNGANLVQTAIAGGSTVTGPAPLTNAPMLGTLASNGGPTQTHALLTGLAGIDAAIGSTATTDQRGFPRPLGLGPDIGAVEANLFPVVTTAADSGAGSLRQTVLNTDPGGTITFTNTLSGSNIVLTSGQLLLNKNLTIDGSALPDGIEINGNNASRIFEVQSGLNVVLTALTITNGNAPFGGGIVNNGTLTVNQSTLSGNSATGDGGAIYSAGPLTVSKCVFLRNTAYEGGGVRSIDSDLSVDNSSFATNTSTVGGACSIAGSGSALFQHLTIVGNVATGNGGCCAGGGLFSYLRPATLVNSIVFGNSAPIGPDIQFSNTAFASAVLTSSGVNLVGNLSFSGLTLGPGVIVGNPLLATLGKYGGPTMAMPPLINSPAIDGCTNGTSFATDQRGLPRIVSAFADIGSVEFTVFIPTLVTLPAVNVSGSNATLVATVNPNNGATGWRFEYGTTTNYGSSSVLQFLSAGDYTATVTNALTGLLPNTLYHFRIEATNSAGGSSGNDLTFTTPAVIPKVVTQPAMNLTTNGATLVATVNPNNAATGCAFEYGTTTNYGSGTSQQFLAAGSYVATVTNQLTGLQPNTLYHFRIEATNSAGAGFGNDVTFTTPALPPTVVTLPAANLTANTATFSATVNPNGAATTYYFEYGTTTNYGTTLAVQNLPAVGTNILVSTNRPGLLPNTLYHFRAVAANSSGTSFGGDQLALLATCSLTLNTNAQMAPATLPDLKLSAAGELFALAVQPDGKIIIGGRFVMVNNVPRRHLARLNPNGSLDETWNPPAPDYQVRAMVLIGTDLYIAGEFRLVGGVNRRHVARLTTAGAGALDPVWDPSTDNQVNSGRFALAISGSSLYISGGFDFIGGQTRAGLARLNLTNGAADPSWNPAPNGRVDAILTSGSDVFMGGNFTSIGGQARNGVVKFDSSGAIDMSWNPNIQSGSVSALAVNGTNLFLGGSFAGIGGFNAISNAAKISTGGTGAVIAPEWVPNPNSSVTALAVANGSVYLGGKFSTVVGQPRQRFAKVGVSGAGTLDTNWHPTPSFSTQFEPTFGTVDRSSISTLVATESAVLAGGSFKAIDQAVSLGIARLDPVTGIRDVAFPASLQLPGEVYAIARQADGRLILGGAFLFASGLPRQNLARVNRDGSLDSTWAPEVNDTVTALALNDTDLFIGGFFTQVNGTNRSYVAKLETLGTDALDASWNTSTNVANPFEGVLVLALDGTNLFAGGSYLSLGGINRPYLAKLSITGSGIADPFWLPTPNGEVGALAVSGTSLFVGGRFTSLGGVSRLAKLSTLGSGIVDTSWNPNPTGSVGGGGTRISSLCVDGTNLFAGGVFTGIGGQSRQCLAKLSIAGGGAADSIWNPIPSGNTGQFCNIRVISLTDSNLYFGGDFYYLGSLSPFFTGLARANRTGTGAVDLNRILDSNFDRAWTYAMLTVGNDVYAGGQFNTLVGVDHSGFIFLPSLAPPMIFQDGLTNLYITRNLSDGPEVSHFVITAIFGGTLYHNDGVTPINCGDFIAASEAGAGLKFNLGGTVTVAPALNNTFPAVSPANTSYTMVTNPTPVFALSAENYSAREGDGSVVFNVRKFGTGAAAVDYATAAITAASGVDYLEKSGRLSFGSAETVKTIFVSIGDDFVAEPDETFTFTLSLVPGANNPQLATPARAFVGIADNDITGGSDSLLTNLLPSAVAVANGALTVDLQPTNALGQWRLLGELNWHNGGDQIVGLVSGNYSVEFRPINGYFQPSATTVPIDGGVVGTNQISHQFTFYYAAATNSDAGNLTANIEPAVVATNIIPNLRGQWRRQGEATWHDSGELIPANAGSYTLEYKPVTGRLTPTPQTVQVGGGNANYGYTATYLMAAAAPGAIAPVVVEFETAVSSAPYLYSGQLQTDVGFASGAVVKPRVVLTVAHALFDDLSLTYVTSARWFFQRYRDKHEPVPQSPRGWYVFSGYATQRGYDNSPGISTPESQAQDIAALYFLEPAGRGGYGGYLAADPAESDLLTENNKMLVGYPLDGVAETNQGKLFATPPSDVHFTRLYTSVFATTNIQSFPGNSGGPMCVQNYDGVYYPAGVYLGGSGQTLVRGIDSDVVDLINRAETSGSGGGNSTGGGVIVMSPGVTAPPFGTGLLTVNFTPATTLNVQPGWRVAGNGGDFLTTTPVTVALIGGGSYPIEFKPVPGFLAPTNRSVQINFSQTTTIQADYVPLRPQLSFSAVSGLTVNGVAGAQYRIESTTNLWPAAVWLPFSTLVLTNNSVTISNTLPLSAGIRFYRAALIP